MNPDSGAVLSAYLGWGNPERDSCGYRLYATDLGPSPRWDTLHKGGRVVEYAMSERGAGEGDRYLVVRVGDRFTSDEMMQRVAAAVAAAVSVPA